MNVLNPKAISMDELYGSVDKDTNEWCDGLVSKLLRNAANLENEDRDWTVFDGPVDAIWIENMNTVLDDNMTLCLANGQRLKLRPQMRMLFEVNDLAVASPATVSRCGMVYLTPEDMSWRPYVQTWIANTFPESDANPVLDEGLKLYLWETFDATVDEGIAKIRAAYTEPVKTDNLQLAKNLCALLSVFLGKGANKGFTSLDPKQRRKDLDSLFAWSYAWALGGALNEQSKDYFDTVVKDKFKGVSFPPAYTVFDYFYDLRKEKTFKSWESRVDPFVYDKETAYFDLFVQTSDTYKHRYVLELLLEIEKPVFFTGETGVGKTSVIANTLDKLSAKNVVALPINFSAQTDSKRTQQSIEEKLEKSRVRFCAPPGKKVAIFVDDINMPATETYGAQPPIELLRMLVDR
jgi:dynein heavy chain